MVGNLKNFCSKIQNVNVFLRILFIFISFIFLQGAYNQNISCDNYLSQNFTLSAPQNTIILNSAAGHSEIITVNDKNEQSVLYGKNQHIIGNNILLSENNLNNYQEINQDRVYSLERLKTGSAIRAP